MAIGFDPRAAGLRRSQSFRRDQNESWIRELTAVGATTRAAIRSQRSIVSAGTSQTIKAITPTSKSRPIRGIRSPGEGNAAELVESNRYRPASFIYQADPQIALQGLLSRSVPNNSTPIPIRNAGTKRSGAIDTKVSLSGSAEACSTCPRVIESPSLRGRKRVTFPVLTINSLHISQCESS